MKVDPPKKNKSQIKLFGQKKKTNAEKVLEELLNANTPAVMIKLPNDQVGVFNLNTNKYEFKGALSNESKNIQSNVGELSDYSFYKGQQAQPTSYTSEIDNQDFKFVEEYTTSDRRDLAFNPQDDINVITSEDIYGPGTRYEINEEALDQAFYDDTRFNRAGEIKLDVDKDVNIPEFTTFEKLNPNLKESKPDDTFIMKAKNKLMKAYSLSPILTQSPVSGRIETAGLPVVGGILSVATGVTELGPITTEVGMMLNKMQTEDVMGAVKGFDGYSGVTAIDLGTGQPIDITGRPSKLGEFFGVGGSVNTNKNIVGPLAFDGQVFSGGTAALDLINYAAKNKFTTEYSLKRYGDVEYEDDEDFKRKTVGRNVQVDPTIGQGDYNPETGQVSLGAKREGDVRGVAINKDGLLSFKTGQSGFVTGSRGEMITTGSGIATSGLRGNIASKNINDLSVSEAQGLLNKINSGLMTSTTNTTTALETLLDDNYAGTNMIPGNYMSGVYAPIEPGATYSSNPFELQFKDTVNTYESGVVYNQAFPDDRFSETLSTDVYSEDYSYLPDDTRAGGSLQPETTSFSTASPSDFDDGGGFDSGSVDTGLGSIDEYTADGGRIGKQEGGTTVKPVSQIVQGAGFIAPQNNATEQQTIADDIPMEAEEGDFIINAPAAQFAGRQDIVTMIVGAIESLREKGVDIQYGNPKIPIKRRVQLAVSRNEVYVPRVVAEEIGYDKLEKINNRGKKEVEQRQQEAQSQASRGGFISKASGDVVEGKDETIQIAMSDLSKLLKTRKEVDRVEEKKLDEPKYEVEKQPVPRENFRNFIKSRFKNLGLKNKYQEQSYDILTLLEIGNDVDPRRGNVPATQTDKSGLTVGLGFDIGQFDLKELQSFGFSNNLIKKMTPYLGLRGQTARSKHGTDMQWALTDQELDEVNKHILTKSIDKFNKEYPEYTKVDPLDYAVLYSAYHNGGLKPDGFLKGKRIKRTPENPKAIRYNKFRKYYDKTGDMENALQMGLVNIIGKGAAEHNRAKTAKQWIRGKYMDRDIISKNVLPTPRPVVKDKVKQIKIDKLPIPKPKEIQVNPDKESFLTPSPSLV
mgnify:CR=1 FL=1